MDQGAPTPPELDRRASVLTNLLHLLLLLTLELGELHLIHGPLALEPILCVSVCCVLGGGGGWGRL